MAAPATTGPETLDFAAGCAFRDGDFDKARAVLAQAMLEHPGDRQLWNDRLEAVNAKAEQGAPAPSPLPPHGVHRDGGPTTAGRFGFFDRAPDPAPPHYCPGCTTRTERDGKTYVHGPKIEEHQAECQGCGVLRSMGRAIQREPEHQAAQAEAAG